MELSIGRAPDLQAGAVGSITDMGKLPLVCIQMAISAGPYFQVLECIGTGIHLQQIDRCWALVNKRLVSLKIDLPLANCSCKQTCVTLN